ncbi:MAG TPA: hypothetical protein VGQ46_14060 [Thermoanaerobaculia bacterium]|nr:hypothetical protein [Thermoanaerobaculia bacterium]
MLAGHLPAIVQEEIGRELGIIATRLTIISALGVYAIVVALVLWLVSQFLAQLPLPSPLLIVTGYLFVESSFRFFVAWITGSPAGSLIGIISYFVFYYSAADRSHAVSPFGREKGHAATITETPAELAETDALLMREALVTLLSPADQARVAARFGYDYRRESSPIAILILFFAAIGIATSLHRGAVISLIAASAIAAEQLYRLAILRRRPAGSILGIAARPFVRNLL